MPWPRWDLVCAGGGPRPGGVVGVGVGARGHGPETLPRFLAPVLQRRDCLAGYAVDGLRSRLLVVVWMVGQPRPAG
jgi:hypothetical protein